MKFGVFYKVLLTLSLYLYYDEAFREGNIYKVIKNNYNVKTLYHELRISFVFGIKMTFCPPTDDHFYTFT